MRKFIAIGLVYAIVQILIMTNLISGIFRQLWLQSVLTSYWPSASTLSPALPDSFP